MLLCLGSVLSVGADPFVNYTPKTSTALQEAYTVVIQLVLMKTSPKNPYSTPVPQSRHTFYCACAQIDQQLQKAV